MSETTSQVQPGEPLREPSPVVAVAPASVPARTPTQLWLWPAVLIVVTQWLVITIPQWIAPGTRVQLNMMIYGAMGGAAAIAAWWLFASRARWIDRLLVLLYFAVTAVAAYPLYHPTFIFRNYGPIVRGLPLATTLWVVWLAISPRLNRPVRLLGLLAAIELAWCYCACLRIDGVDGSFDPAVSWRWSATAEDRFLAELKQKGPAAPATIVGDAAPLKLQAGDWPGFRGSNRDSRLANVRIATEWKAHQPRELWRHNIGPGWSSFAVVGERIYTQEQRGDEEAVVCYDAATGKEWWAHVDTARFFETIGGPGPRATPTFDNGRLYTLGAKGTLNCLDPATGKSLWSKDILADSGREKPPEWGFASSPLVVRGLVLVFAGGPGGKSVLAYRASSGDLAWSAGNGTESYSSLHQATIDKVEQVLFSSSVGLTSFDPTNGRILWQDDWDLKDMAPIAQPAFVSDSEIVYGNQKDGARRLRVSHTNDKWVVDNVWENDTQAIKPYYNDLVVYKDHIYGFDGSFLTCVNLADGKRQWKARGYGNGQVVLLADQGLLLVSSEKGQAALVEANPKEHKELARFQAIEGKTWNHPVVAHGKLFIRNGEQIACFELAESGAPVVAK
jgi:outer membrane protein assembly factor BamB